jgi:hypothetical protein
MHVKPIVSAAYSAVVTTKPHWARMEGYGPFSLCVIHKEGLCPSSGGINSLMMMTRALEKNGENEYDSLNFFPTFGRHYQHQPINNTCDEWVITLYVDPEPTKSTGSNN